MDLEATISAILSRALGQLDHAATLDAVEAVRVEALGRKGKLAEISKEMGKLAPEERARIGQAPELGEAGSGRQNRGTQSRA